MEKYKISKNSTSQLVNEWFKKCENQNIPYIVITKRTKYSQIEWDYINLGRKFFNIFKNDEKFNDEHINNMIGIFKKYSNCKARYTITGLTLTAHNILNEEAPKFAEELFDYLNSLINRIE